MVASAQEQSAARVWASVLSPERVLAVILVYPESSEVPGRVPALDPW